MTEKPDNDNLDETSTHVILATGTMVAHYQIVDKIGAGGMGEVYLAEDTKLNRKVALKFLPVSMTSDSDMRSRFTREAQAAAKLNHPNIVTIHEVSEHCDRPFFAMQYIEGKALNRYHDQESLPLARIVQLVAQVADGLGKAHAPGIIHRDIKSANIMVDAVPRILDFGLATVQGADGLTKTGSTLGTIAYMSPEQAQDRICRHPATPMLLDNDF
jgi:serine/threonine protein kinase